MPLPLDLRSRDISAIYKKGSKLDANNYRPISLKVKVTIFDGRWLEASMPDSQFHPQ
jgi:hypothetical protein